MEEKGTQPRCGWSAPKHLFFLTYLSLTMLVKRSVFDIITGYAEFSAGKPKNALTE